MVALMLKKDSYNSNNLVKSTIKFQMQILYLILEIIKLQIQK